MSDNNDLIAEDEILAVARRTSSLNLREFTQARIGLAATGVSIGVRHSLEFSLAHAIARDAVHSALAIPSLMTSLCERGLVAVAVCSAAADRIEYLRRPDLGRTLGVASASLLAETAVARSRRQLETRLSIIIADGLSALATERHALPVIDALLSLLKIAEPGCNWVLTPIVVAEQARVGLGDEIGQVLNADITVMLIGERPGLSSPDSLGAYITWSPQPVRTDAERNCVSNIRTEGLSYASAAAKIAWYVSEGRRLGLTGVSIREREAAAGYGQRVSPH